MIKFFTTGLFVILILQKYSVAAGPICQNEDTEVINQVMSVISDVEKPNSNIRSVDDFLKKLPDSMKKDFILMTESRSFQESSSKNPRVLLKSPNSEIIVSFNTDPKHRGYDRLEIMRWNGAQAKYEFEDVHFEGETPGKTSNKGVVSHNPGACLRCHQDPPRPNWDPYNFWHGQTPFNRDTLAKGGKEEEIYMNFMQRIQNKEPRIGILKPTNSMEKIKSGLKDYGTYQLGTSDSSDGPGVRIFDQMTRQNQCRISNMLDTDPNADIFKYAAYMAISCSNPEEAFPSWAKDRMNTYYQSRGIKPKNGESMMDAVRNDTDTRQKRVFEEKIARQKLFFLKEMGGDAKKAQVELERRELENRETSLEQVAPLRYALEPWGVNVDKWSMSLDPGTYSFADLFGGMSNTAFFRKVYNEVGGDCEKAKQLSLAAFEKQKSKLINTKMEADVCETCQARIETAESKALEMSKNIKKELVADSAHKLFDKYGCVECHTGGNAYGAPEIPFGNKEDFSKFVKSYAGNLTGWDGLMWDRITRSDDKTRMPAFAPAITDPNDLATIKAYLNNTAEDSKASTPAN